MTTATQGKISKAFQAQQTLVYQQEKYREIASKLVDFNNKYFSYSSSTGASVLSSSFFESYTVDSSSKYVSVSGDEDAINNFSISSISSVATSAKYISDVTVSSQTITTNAVTPSTVISDTEQYISFNFNGEGAKINLSSSITDAASLKNYLQDKLDEEYGTGKINVGLTAENCITFTASSANNTDILSISGISTDLSAFLGIDETAGNRIDKSSSLKDVNFSAGLAAQDSYEMTINGTSFTFENTMSLEEIMEEINDNDDAGVEVYYSSTTDTFTVKSKKTGSSSDISISDVSGNLAETLFGSSATIDANKTQGTDTVMTYTLNGNTRTVTRSTANFSIDEISITLNKGAEDTAAEDYPITFNVTNDAEKVLERVTEFINDYNDILSLVNKEITAKHDRNYPPLTPKQEEDMTDEEIKNWEEKAREGLLFGDSILRGIVSGLREAVSGKTSVSKFTLSEIGIKPASLDTSGKLEIDRDVFLEKLAQNRDEVADLFSGESSSGTSGIAVQIKGVLKYNVGNYGRSGALVEKAGLDSNSTSDDNYLSDRIEDYEGKLDELKKYLEDEKEKYWKKFSDLETAMSSLNVQSNMISSMLSS
jgi:flagellar hook-associated protein 2